MWHERITSFDNPLVKGAQQLAGVCQYLLWLVWVGIQMPPLDKILQLYLRRFTLETSLDRKKSWTLPGGKIDRQLSTVNYSDRISFVNPPKPECLQCGHHARVQFTNHLRSLY